MDTETGNVNTTKIRTISNSNQKKKESTKSQKTDENKSKSSSPDLKAKNKGVKTSERLYNMRKRKGTESPDLTLSTNK